MSMRVFWAILLLLLAMPPILIPLCSARARKDFWRKSAIEIVAGVVPRKYQLIVSVIYLGLVLFAAAKAKGLF